MEKGKAGCAARVELEKARAGVESRSTDEEGFNLCWERKCLECWAGGDAKPCHSQDLPQQLSHFGSCRAPSHRFPCPEAPLCTQSKVWVLNALMCTSSGNSLTQGVMEKMMGQMELEVAVLPSTVTLCQHQLHALVASAEDSSMTQNHRICCGLEGTSKGCLVQPPSTSSTRAAWSEAHSTWL